MILMTYMVRTCILTNIAQTLMLLADEYCIAVVLMNQVTTKVTERAQDKGGKNNNQLIPALGESWSHACTN